MYDDEMSGKIEDVEHDLMEMLEVFSTQVANDKRFHAFGHPKVKELYLGQYNRGAGYLFEFENGLAFDIRLYVESLPEEVAEVYFDSSDEWDD